MRRRRGVSSVASSNQVCAVVCFSLPLLSKIYLPAATWHKSEQRAHPQFGLHLCSSEHLLPTLLIRLSACHPTSMSACLSPGLPPCLRLTISASLLFLLSYQYLRL